MDTAGDLLSVMQGQAEKKEGNFLALHGCPGPGSMAKLGSCDKLQMR